MVMKDRSYLKSDRSIRRTCIHDIKDLVNSEVKEKKDLDKLDKVIKKREVGEIIELLNEIEDFQHEEIGAVKELQHFVNVLEDRIIKMVHESDHRIEDLQAKGLKNGKMIEIAQKSKEEIGDIEAFLDRERKLARKLNKAA